MKITRIRWAAYSLPFRAPYTTSGGSFTHRQGLLLELSTDTGLIGLGEAAPVPEAEVEAAELARRFASVAGGLVGLVLDENGLAEASSSQPEAADAALACGLDMAVCDLLAQRQGRGLAAWLRPSAAPSVAVNALITAPDLIDAAKAAETAREAGYGTVKLKVGMAEDMTLECARVTAVRKALGPEIGLRLDPNGAWDISTAITAMRALAPLNIEYVEQPIAAGNLEALRYLQDRIDVDIAADEDVRDLATAKRIIHEGAARVLVLKPQRLGGLRPCLAIMEAAGQSGVDCVVTTSIESGAGVAACLQLAAAAPGDRAHGLATLDLLPDSLIVPPALLIDQGRMGLPDAPGLGIQLDEAAVARYSDGWQEVS